MQAVEGRRKIQGENHPDTLWSMTTLASTLFEQNRIEEAEQLCVRIMEGYKRMLGRTIPKKVESILNLARFYCDHRHREKAEQSVEQGVEQLGREIRDVKHAKHGVVHPDTPPHMSFIVGILAMQGRWEEAGQLLTQILDLKQTKHGDSHFSTITHMSLMMLILGRQGRWKEAEQLAIQAMETTAAKFGVDHPDTLNSVIKLAPFCKQNRGKEVSQLMIKIFQTNVAKDGAENPDTLRAFSSLVGVFYKKGEWEIAEMLLTHILEKSKSNLGSDHPNTLIYLGRLAIIIWKASGRHAEAIDLLRDCLAKSRRILAPDCDYILRGSRILLAWETENIWVND